MAGLPVDELLPLHDKAHVGRITLEPVEGSYDLKRRNAAVTCKNRVPYPDNVPVPV